MTRPQNALPRKSSTAFVVSPVAPSFFHKGHCFPTQMHIYGQTSSCSIQRYRLPDAGSWATLLVLHPPLHQSPPIHQNHPCHHLLILLLLLLLLIPPPLDPKMWLVCKFGKGCSSNHFLSEEHTLFLLSERRIMTP